MLYRQKFGSLNIGLRLEAGFATLAAIQTGKPIKDFGPHLFKKEEEIIDEAQQLNAENINLIMPCKKELKKGEKFGKTKSKTKQGKFK